MLPLKMCELNTYGAPLKRKDVLNLFKHVSDWDYTLEALSEYLQDVGFNGVKVVKQRKVADLIMVFERSFKGKYLSDQRTFWQFITTCNPNSPYAYVETLSDRLEKCSSARQFRARFKAVGSTELLNNHHIQTNKVEFNGMLYARIRDTRDNNNKSWFFRNDHLVSDFIDKALAHLEWKKSNKQRRIRASKAVIQTNSDSGISPKSQRSSPVIPLEVALCKPENQPCDTTRSSPVKTREVALSILYKYKTQIHTEDNKTKIFDFLYLLKTKNLKSQAREDRGQNPKNLKTEKNTKNTRSLYFVEVRVVGELSYNTSLFSSKTEKISPNFLENLDFYVNHRIPVVLNLTYSSSDKNSSFAFDHWLLSVYEPRIRLDGVKTPVLDVFYRGVGGCGYVLKKCLKSPVIGVRVEHLKNTEVFEVNCKKESRVAKSVGKFSGYTTEKFLSEPKSSVKTFTSYIKKRDESGKSVVRGADLYRIWVDAITSHNLAPTTIFSPKISEQSRNYVGLVSMFTTFVQGYDPDDFTGFVDTVMARWSELSKHLKDTGAWSKPEQPYPEIGMFVYVFPKVLMWYASILQKEIDRKKLAKVTSVKVASPISESALNNIPSDTSNPTGSVKKETLHTSESSTIAKVNKFEKGSPGYTYIAQGFKYSPTGEINRTYEDDYVDAIKTNNAYMAAIIMGALEKKAVDLTVSLERIAKLRQ